MVKDARAFGNDAIGGIAITASGRDTAIERSAIEDAAFLAGFPRATVIDAPIAVASYHHFNGGVEGSMIVIDVGGAGFDCALVNADDNGFLIAAWISSANNGSLAVDQAISRAISDQFKVHFGIDLPSDARHRGATPALCRRGKVASGRDSAPWVIRRKMLFGRRILPFAFSRRHALALLQPIISQVADACKKILANAPAPPEVLF